jgi:hypothetical protein
MIFTLMTSIAAMRMPRVARNQTTAISRTLLVQIVQLVWLLAHPVPFGYDSCAMLSRAQEARVRALLRSSPAGTVQT